MGTQWHTGMSGPIGLRYEAFPEVRLAYEVDASEWPDLFDAIRVMEVAALETLRSIK